MSEIPAPDANGYIRRSNPVCDKEIGEADCGYCVFTITDKPIYVGERPENQFRRTPWSKLKLSAVLLPGLFSYAPIKAYFINTCKEFGDCNKDLARWRIKLDSLDSVGDILIEP